MAERLADEIAAESGGAADWDSGAGEAWAQIVLGESVVAVVAMKIPLIIFTSALKSDALLASPVELVQVADFEEKIFYCDLSDLSAVFGESDRYDLIDLKGFSAEELWYVTI